MKDSKLKLKKLKIDYNRILVLKETSSIVDCLLITIVKKLRTGFAVYIKYEGVNFHQLSIMNSKTFFIDSLEEAHSFSVRAEAFFRHKGFSRLEDSSASKFKLRSRISDELSRGWKTSYCGDVHYSFTNNDIDNLEAIISYFNLPANNLDEETYAAGVKVLAYENYDAKTHRSCVFNCHIDIIMDNNYEYIWDAICIDNKGYEDEFDLNVSYVIDGNERAEFLKVYDKFGVKQELSNTRFKIEMSIE